MSERTGSQPRQDATPLAGCPSCGAPLIPTTVFRKAEFFCLECGRKYGFLSPDRLDPTPATLARYEQLKAEWDEHAGGKLRVGCWWFRWCDQCKIGDDAAYHECHATDEERAAHAEALAWLRERAAA